MAGSGNTGIPETVRMNEAESLNNTEVPAEVQEFLNKGHWTFTPIQMPSQNSSSYAAVANPINNIYPLGYGNAKPIFLNEQDVFGNTTPDKKSWITGEEIYLSIGSVVPPENIILYM